MKMERSGSRAFSLVEVTLALGVAAISLIAIFGLLVTGTQTNHTAIEQSSSCDLLTAVAADLCATSKATTTSTQFRIAIGTDATLFFNAAGQSTTIDAARYRLKIRFPASPGGRSATWVHLRMTWPARLDPDLGTSVNFGTAETFVALDRN